MSAPVYNVSVDGNNNDSNLILGSANGNIVEDDKYDDTNIVSKLTELESALNVNSASDLAQAALVDANTSGVTANALGVASNASGVTANLNRLDIHEGLVLKNIADISDLSNSLYSVKQNLNKSVFKEIHKDAMIYEEYDALNANVDLKVNMLSEEELNDDMFKYPNKLVQFIQEDAKKVLGGWQGSTDHSKFKRNLFNTTNNVRKVHIKQNDVFKNSLNTSSYSLPDLYETRVKESQNKHINVGKDSGNLIEDTFYYILEETLFGYYDKSRKLQILSFKRIQFDDSNQNNKILHLLDFIIDEKEPSKLFRIRQGRGFADRPYGRNGFSVNWKVDPNDEKNLKYFEISAPSTLGGSNNDEEAIKYAYNKKIYAATTGPNNLKSPIPVLEVFFRDILSIHPENFTQTEMESRKHLRIVFCDEFGNLFHPESDDKPGVGFRVIDDVYTIDDESLYAQRYNNANGSLESEQADSFGVGFYDISSGKIDVILKVIRVDNNIYNNLDNDIQLITNNNFGVNGIYSLKDESIVDDLDNTSYSGWGLKNSAKITNTVYNESDKTYFLTLDNELYQSSEGQFNFIDESGNSQTLQLNKTPIYLLNTLNDEEFKNYKMINANTNVNPFILYYDESNKKIHLTAVYPSNNFVPEKIGSVITISSQIVDTAISSLIKGNVLENIGEELNFLASEGFFGEITTVDIDLVKEYRNSGVFTDQQINQYLKNVNSDEQYVLLPDDIYLKDFPDDPTFRGIALLTYYYKVNSIYYRTLPNNLRFALLEASVLNVYEVQYDNSFNVNLQNIGTINATTGQTFSSVSLNNTGDVLSLAINNTDGSSNVKVLNYVNGTWNENKELTYTKHIDKIELSQNTQYPVKKEPYALILDDRFDTISNAELYRDATGNPLHYTGQIGNLVNSDLGVRDVDTTKQDPVTPINMCATIQNGNITFNKDILSDTITINGLSGKTFTWDSSSNSYVSGSDSITFNNFEFAQFSFSPSTIRQTINISFGGSNYKLEFELVKYRYHRGKLVVATTDNIITYQQNKTNEWDEITNCNISLDSNHNCSELLLNYVGDYLSYTLKDATSGVETSEFCSYTRKALNIPSSYTDGYASSQNKISKVILSFTDKNTFAKTGFIEVSDDNTNWTRVGCWGGGYGSLNWPFSCYPYIGGSDYGPKWSEYNNFSAVKQVIDFSGQNIYGKYVRVRDVEYNATWSMNINSLEIYNENNELIKYGLKSVPYGAGFGFGNSLPSWSGIFPNVPSGIRYNLGPYRGGFPTKMKLYPPGSIFWTGGQDWEVSQFTYYVVELNTSNYTIEGGFLHYNTLDLEDETFYQEIVLDNYGSGTGKILSMTGQGSLQFTYDDINNVTHLNSKSSLENPYVELQSVNYKLYPFFNIISNQLITDYSSFIQKFILISNNSDLYTIGSNTYINNSILESDIKSTINIAKSEYDKLDTLNKTYDVVSSESVSVKYSLTEFNHSEYKFKMVNNEVHLEKL